MNDLISKLKQRYQSGSIVEKLIFINIAVFILTYFLGSLSWLFGTESNVFFEWLALPAFTDELLIKPWTLISYGFMHADFMHLLFNLIMLYYIGNLFLDYFIPKQLISFYLWGTLIGGLVFVLSYNYFPQLQQQNASLVGASSGISAILIAIATYMPNYELKLRFIGFVKLWVLAVVFISLDIIQLPNGNAGGHLAHLGGALYGFLAIYYKGSNPFKELFKKRTILKTSYKAKNKRKPTATPSEVQQKINGILDKISKSGYESLSKDEKEFLFQQGKK